MTWPKCVAVAAVGLALSACSSQNTTGQTSSSTAQPTSPPATSIPATPPSSAGSELEASDLIIYYADQPHVAMAVDSVRAAHASTEGVPVKIADINSIGPINVIRRLEG